MKEEKFIVRDYPLPVGSRGGHNYLLKQVFQKFRTYIQNKKKITITIQ